MEKNDLSFKDACKILSDRATDIKTTLSGGWEVSARVVGWGIIQTVNSDLSEAMIEAAEGVNRAIDLRNKR